MMPDREVVNRLRGEEAEAREVLAQLFRTMYAPLCALADAYTGVPQTSEEIVSDVFVWLWEHRTTWRPTGSVEVYLMSAVRNRVRNVLRDTRTRERLLEERPYDDDARVESSAHEMIEVHDDTNALVEALRALPAAQRVVMTLRWQRQLSWQEVAEVMGISVAAAQMQHTRAMRGVRERFKR